MLPFHFATLFTDLAEMGYGESTKIQIAILVEQCVGEKINQDITTGAFQICPKVNQIKCVYNLVMAGKSDSKHSDFEDVTLELFEATVKLMEDLDPKSLLENKVKNEKLKNKFVSPAEKI